MSSSRARIALTTTVALIGCSSGKADSADDAAAPARDTNRVTYAYNRIQLDTTRTPGAAIDSVFPIPEMVRRFRAGLPVLTALERGAHSRDALVAQFITALSTSDKTTLGRLTLSRAEYAFLYFPNTPDATRDNGLTPQRGWDQLTLASEKGIARSLTRVGGKPLALQSLECANPPTIAGLMRLHAGCTVRIRLADGTDFAGRIFGSIIEYAGQFKFVGYANDM